jgi:hypothetical protein
MILLALGAVCPGQDVGMGTRRGTGAHMEAPYTLEIETPHVKWARPLAGGPLRVLAVPTVSEGRTLVELAERVSLDLTTVSIDPQFDANKWTMAFGRDYGARAEKGNLSLIYGYLEAELTGPKQFDVILLQVPHGWDRLTPKSREALARRVREGCGLVVMRPMGGEGMPLELTAPVSLPADASQQVEPPLAEASPWKRAADHYITRAIPVESFPFSFLQHYSYKTSPAATVLVQSETGQPVVAAQEFGKGRVVAFGYRNSGLSWRMPPSARGFVSNQYWEYFYAMIARSLIWAAHRDPAAADFAQAAWELKNEDGKLVRSGKGPRPNFNLVPGRYFLELRTAADFRIEAIDSGKPQKLELTASRELAAEGDTVEVKWTPAAQATAEIIDGFGRVIARGSGTGTAKLECGRPLTHSGFVLVGRDRLPIRFASSNRKWEDYEVIMPWYGPGSWQPWIDALDNQFRAAGITTLANPDRNFKVIASAGLHDVFGVYAYRATAYTKRKAAYAETGDKKYLTRDVVLQNPDFEKDLKSQLSARLERLAPLKPLAYYLADESSLTSYTDAFDVDWAPAAIDGLRQWLRGQYKTLDALNASWGTAFRNWESVLPMTTAEAQKHGNFAPWADHRAYMEQEFVASMAKARNIVKEIDPGAPASISGTQIPTAHNGANWYAIDQIMDYLQPYSGGSQDPMHHLFKPGILLSGFTGYGTTGPALYHQQWQRLFYGHTGASIFWHYTVLNPDLTLSEQGKAMGDVFGKLQSGIGRVFMNSRVKEDGVAIHFSMASIRGAWITDGQIRPKVGNVLGTSKNYADLAGRRDAWVKALERQGVQFRFLATPQLEAGDLDRYKVLILPYSIALSDAEAKAIDRFLERGGIVYADEQTGKMDERCHWRKTPLLAGERKNLIRQEPGPIVITPAFPVEGEFLTTIRDFGKSRLVGLLSKDPQKVKLPVTKAVRYDLLRGGIAAAELEVSSQHPALLVERATRIQRLELTPALEVGLTDEGGAPVDRSVVHLEVRDPAGKLVRHYSGNVTIENGRAKFAIPFALSDARGTWKVTAKDVVSGLTAERTLVR